MLTQTIRAHTGDTVNNNRTLIVGPSFSSEFYLMLIKLKNRDKKRSVFIVTRPLEQYEEVEKFRVTTKVI